MSENHRIVFKIQYVIGTDPSSCKGTMMSLEVCEPRVHSACADGEVSVIVNGEPKCTPCIAGVEDYATGTCKDVRALRRKIQRSWWTTRALGKTRLENAIQADDGDDCLWRIRRHT